MLNFLNAFNSTLHLFTDNFFAAAFLFSAAFVWLINSKKIQDKLSKTKTDLGSTALTLAAMGNGLLVIPVLGFSVYAIFASLAA